MIITSHYYILVRMGLVQILQESKNKVRWLAELRRNEKREAMK